MKKYALASVFALALTAANAASPAYKGAFDICVDGELDFLSRVQLVLTMRDFNSARQICQRTNAQPAYYINQKRILEALKVRSNLFPNRLE